MNSMQFSEEPKLVQVEEFYLLMMINDQLLSFEKYQSFY